MRPAPAYVSADLTGVGMQGANGATADGRMAAVGMVWNPGAAGQVRYVCGMTGGLAAPGDPRRRQAAQVGMDAARRWVAISDGGAGIEDWLRTYFPRAGAVIPDFWHAAQHPSEWAKALHPDDAAEATRVAAEWCHELKHEGGAAVLEGLRARTVGRRRRRHTGSWSGMSRTRCTGWITRRTGGRGGRSDRDRWKRRASRW